jgi:hypothetical protein
MIWYGPSLRAQSKGPIIRTTALVYILPIPRLCLQLHAPDAWFLIRSPMEAPKVLLLPFLVAVVILSLEVVADFKLSWSDLVLPRSLLHLDVCDLSFGRSQLPLLLFFFK